MPDQAQRLRELMRERESVVERPVFTHARTIAVTSGKGGVGKSNLVTNLSIALARLGRQVLILDADLGLANVDMLLGIKPKYNLHHVITERKGLAEVIMTGPENVRIVPGGSGIQELADMGHAERDILLEKLQVIETQFDYVLIDTGAGLSKNIVGFAAAADMAVVVTTPEPTSVMDAYQMIKVVHQTNMESNLKLVVNMAKSRREALKTAESMVRVARQFLNIGLDYLGDIPYDESVRVAVQKWVPFVVDRPACPASRSIHRIAEVLHKPDGSDHGSGLFSRLFRFFKG